MSGRITQSVIARQAGVHRTTVSLALRNHPSIPILTRERIRLLAASLHYRPDPSLSALVAYRNGSRNKVCSSVVAYITNRETPFAWRNLTAHGDFFSGATSRAEQLGYSVDHFWWGEYRRCPRRLPQVLASRGIRGVVFASHWGEPIEVERAEWENFSLVKIDPQPASVPCDFVTNDQRSVLQTTMRHILEQGYRRVGFVWTRSWDDAVDLAWSAGFLPLQSQLPAADRIPMFLYGERFGDAADFPREEFLRWWRKWKPDVILGHGPFALPALAGLGLRVPEDVAFADLLLTDGAAGIAGMHQNSRQVGEVALDLLAARLSRNETGWPKVPVSTLVPGTWVDGASLPTRSP